MSAVPPIASEFCVPQRKTPSATCGTHALQQQARVGSLFDHLVGDGEHPRRKAEAERLRGLEIDQEFELGWLQHRKVSRSGTAKNSAGVNAGLTIRISKIGGIGTSSMPSGSSASWAGVLHGMGYRSIPTRRASSISAATGQLISPPADMNSRWP
jgi:hypothetical protein